MKLNRRNEKGVSVIGLLITVLIIGFLGFIAVPSLLEAGRIANTEGAFKTVKAIDSAIRSQGGQPSLMELADQLQIEKAIVETEFPYRGYFFTLLYDDKGEHTIKAKRYNKESGLYDIIVKPNGQVCYKQGDEPTDLTGSEPELKCIDPQQTK